jgi:hypothetical protein
MEWNRMFTTGAAYTALTGGVYKKVKSSVLGKAREREREIAKGR